MKRNIGVCILLSLVTCGIYALYWLIVLNEDINTLSGESGVSGGMLILFTILTCGIFTIFWMYNAGEKIQIAQQRHGVNVSSSLGILYLILTIFGLGLVAYALMQDNINKLAK